LESLCEKDHSFIELRDICVSNHGKLGYHLRKMRDIVERDPIRKVYRLTDEGRLLYQWFIDALSDFMKRRLDLTVTADFNPIRYAEKLSLSDHASFFYEDEALKRAVSLPFLRTGLQGHLAVIYLASEQIMDREAKEIRRSITDIEELEKKGSFTIMSGEEWYLRRGRATADVIINNWLKLAEEKIRQGYKGLQIAGEMAPFIDDAKTSELLTYERKLGKKLSLMACALCMHDAAKLQPELLVSVIKAHGHGIFEGIAFELG